MRYVILIIFSAIIFSCSTTKQTTTTANQPKTQTETVSNDIIATQQLASVVSNLGTNSQNQRFGAYLTTGSVTQDKINSFRGLLKGIRFRQGIFDVSTAPGVFNFAGLQVAINLAVTNKLSIITQTWRSPIQNIPAYYYNGKPYLVPIVNTDNTNPSFKQFPYYLDQTFQQLVFQEDTAEANFLSGLNTTQKQTLLAKMVNPGTTGDFYGYKGTPTLALNGGKNYAISNQTWINSYSHPNISEWVSLNNSKNKWLNVAANPNNDNIDFDWQVANGVTYEKKGWSGHGYSASGEGADMKINLTYLAKYPNLVYYSESEGVQQDTSWHQANFFPLVGSFLNGGGKILSVDATDNVTSVSLAFLNKYAGSPVGGFSMMRDVIDYADTVRFPQSKYGVLIDPTRLLQYQKQVQNVQQDPTLGEAAKEDKYSSLLQNYIYEQRVAAIQYEYTKKGYIFNPNSQYYNDGGVDLWAGNYESRLHLSNPNDAPAVQRVGSRDSAFGRYTRMLTKTGLFFDLDNTYSLGDTATISITYYDIKSGFQYLIKYFDKKKNLTAITPYQKAKGTGTWVTDVITIPNLSQTGLFGHTFSIYAVTNNTYLSVVEIR